jgi:hypothetical protein
LVQLRLGAQTLFLDAGNEYCPFGLLPINDLAGRGLLIEPAAGRIIDIPSPPGANMQFASTQAKLDERGDLHCQTMLRFEGYCGLAARETLSRKSVKDYANDMLQPLFSEVTIDSFQVSGLNAMDMPLRIRMKYRVAGFAHVLNEKIYFSPALLHRLAANPLKQEKRAFPITYEHNQATTEEINFILPAGYRILETPKSSVLKHDGLRFAVHHDAGNNAIQYQRQMVLYKMLFAPHEYAALRSFYEHVVSADQRQIVLEEKPN